MSYTYKEVQQEGGIDVANKGIRTYTRRFIVTSTGMNDNPGDVSAAVPILLYSSWPSDAYALCKQKKATQRLNDPFAWDVEVNYDSGPLDNGQGDSSGSDPSGDPGQQNSDVQPDLRPPTISIDTIETKKIFVKDLITGDAVCASNGQPFDPPHEIAAYHPQISVSLDRALADESYAKMVQYTNKVNDGIWQGFADQTVLCKKYKLGTKYEQGQWWWTKEVVLEVNPDGPWNPLKLLDCGTYERISMGIPRYVPIKDAEGNPVSSPVPLNGGGGVLPADQPVQFRDYTAYAKTSFANIII